MGLTAYLQFVSLSSRRRCDINDLIVVAFRFRAAQVWLEEVVHQQGKMAEVIELQKLKVGGALNMYLLHTLGKFISK